MNVAVLGRADKGFGDSKSVLNVLVGIQIFYKEEKGSGEWAEEEGCVCLPVILFRPGGLCLSSASAWGSCCPLRGTVWVP